MNRDNISIYVNGKLTEKTSLSEKNPIEVFYLEHTKLTKKYRKGRSKEVAQIDKRFREAWAYLTAAEQILEELFNHEYLRRAITPLSAPVIYEDGEQVNLEDYEEQLREEDPAIQGHVLK